MDTDVTVTGIVVGTLLPNVIALVVQPGWRPEIRGLVAFLICVLAGTLVAALEGRLGGQDVAASVVTVLIISQVMYRTLWHSSGIAPAIERATVTSLPGTPTDA